MFAIDEATAEAAEYQRQFLADKEEEILQLLADNDVTVTEPDRAAFREATADVQEAVSEQVPADLVERIQAAN